MDRIAFSLPSIIAGLPKVVWQLTTVIFVTAILSMTTPLLNAQDNDGGQQRRQTKRTPTMSEKVYRQLLTAQEMIEAKDYEKGLAALRNLERARKLTSYEKAQLYNYFAYTYFTLEKYKDALRYYEKVIAEPDNTDGLLLNTLYTVAQLYFILEDYRKAIQAINRWFEVAPEPSLNAYMVLGQAYYQLEQYRQALVPLTKAHKMVSGRKDKPSKNLLLLLQNIYLELEDFENMILILKELIVVYPDDEHWRSLSAAYSMVEQYDKQMAILEMLYETGHLNNGRSQLNLANLYLMHDAPYKAAVLLDEGTKTGKIEKNERNLRLLSQSWQQAQEFKQSIAPLKEATKIAKDGDLHVRLAQAYISMDQYDNAVETLNAGLKKGGLRRPDQANLMLGMALFELQRFNSARTAFNAAVKDKRSEKAAQDWIKYVDNERTRKKQLEESLQRKRS